MTRIPIQGAILNKLLDPISTIRDKRAPLEPVWITI